MRKPLDDIDLARIVVEEEVERRKKKKKMKKEAKRREADEADDGAGQPNINGRGKSTEMGNKMVPRLREYHLLSHHDHGA